jgi:transcriptional regulator with XRE-family HTH domain
VPLDYERVARELIRALRGRRSRAELSRRAGYKSNMVHRWEAGSCWPTASVYLQLHRRFRPTSSSWIERFFHTQPSWACALDATSPAAVAAFLRALRGKTPVLRVAELSECNRFSVSRWMAGSTEPRLPDFLRLVQACSRRLLDFAAALEDPEELPSLRASWRQQQLARKAAYDLPWSHAVLRGLELVDCPRAGNEQEAFLARKLGIDSARVREALRVLQATAQVKRSGGGFVPREVTSVDTGADPVRAHALRTAWAEVAVERLQRRAPGKFVWTVFAASKEDLTRMHTLHLQYLRAMQEVIASSVPSECVGLYCAQLLDLGEG